MQSCRLNQVNQVNRARPDRRRPPQPGQLEPCNGASRPKRSAVARLHRRLARLVRGAIRPRSTERREREHGIDRSAGRTALRRAGARRLGRHLQPNWWSQPPTILKGWIDRVFRLNTAYGYPPGVGFEGVPVGLLKARHALIFNTSNTPLAREHAVFGDPLETLWKTSVFALCGVDSVVRHIYTPMAGSNAEQRAAWLAEVEALTRAAAR